MGSEDTDRFRPRPPARAGGVPRPDTRLGRSALYRGGVGRGLGGGGTQTFGCAPGSTITISGTKYVSRSVTLDGGGAHGVFLVNRPYTLGVVSLTITGGTTSSSIQGGGGIGNTYGTVNVTNGTIRFIGLRAE